MSTQPKKNTRKAPPIGRLLRSVRDKVRPPQGPKPSAWRSPLQKYRDMGVTIGKDCQLYGVLFDTNFPFLIEVGNRVLMAHGSTVLAHDAAPARVAKLAKVGKVRILDDCFIGHGAVILPGVTVGPRSIVGANSVVSKDVPPDTVVGGVPAKVLCSTQDYAKRLQENPRVRLLPYPNLASDSHEHAHILHEYIEDVRRRAKAGEFD